MYVRLAVTPGAKREFVKKTGDCEYEIAVKEIAKQNAANRRVCELMAREYGVVSGAVRLISGHRSGHKIVNIQSKKHD